MNKSSILSKAGHQSLSNSIIHPVLIQKNTSKQQDSLQYLKSSISDNLLQQMDDDYQQIQNYQTKYVDQSGKYVDQSGKYLDQSGKYINQSVNQSSQILNLSQSKIQSQNEFLPQKSKHSKNRFTNQPIIQEPHHTEDEQTQSPIKNFNKPNSKPSSKQSNSANIFSQQSSQRPGTLLKNYSKTMNKYEQQMDIFSEQKRNIKNKLNEKKTYLTNSRGLKEEQFYKVDYNNTGKYKSNGSTINNSYEGTPAFFNTKTNELQAIQDILSDIKSLNEASSNTKYTSAKVFSKGSIDSLGSSMGKYKGNKNFGSFGSSSRKFDTSSRGNSNSITSKLDDLLTSYKLGDSMMGSSSYGNSPLRKDLSISSHNEGNMPNESNISRSSRFDDRTNRELSKMKRQQDRKNNKYYEEVKNQIKYGIPESQQRQIQEFNKNQLSNFSQTQNQTKKKSIKEVDLKEKSIKEIDLKEKSIKEIDLSKKNLSQNIENTQDPQKNTKDQYKNKKDQYKNKKDPQKNKKDPYKNKKDSQESRPDKQTNELVKKLKLYHINWNQIPLIPRQCHESLYQFKSYPNFTSDQTQLLISIFNKLSTNNIHTYSIFPFSININNNHQLVGLKQLATQSKNKTQSKSYKLLNKKEFIETWNILYQQSIKNTNNDSITLNQEQIEILIQFDLKWYTALVKFVYSKDLSTLTQSYKNKNQQQYQALVNSNKYIQALTNIQHFSSSQNLSIIQSITSNKLILLKNIFSSLTTSLSTQYSFGIIPSMINVKRSQKQQQIIKEFLKDNFRGGIYYTDIQNFKNVCILELNRNKTIQIDQISNEHKKQVWINKKIVLNLKNKDNSQQNTFKGFFEINIIVGTSTQEDQENYQEEETVKLNCCYNQIQYEVDQEQISQQILHFCKKYQILLNS